MQRVREVIAKVLGVGPDFIKYETTPADIDTWDSFNALVLVTALESEFKVKFTMDEVVAVKCVGDIKESLEKHGVQLEDN